MRVTVPPDIVLDQLDPGADRAFKFGVLVETKLPLLRFGLFPCSGEFDRMAVRSLDPPLGAALLAAACVRFGEFDRDVFGFDWLACRRRFPRTGLKRSRSWRPWRASGSFFPLRFVALVRDAVKDRLRTGLAVLRVW
jgi:hypothetical protein